MWAFPCVALHKLIHRNHRVSYRDCNNSAIYFVMLRTMWAISRWGVRHWEAWPWHIILKTLLTSPVANLLQADSCSYIWGSGDLFTDALFIKPVVHYKIFIPVGVTIFLRRDCLMRVVGPPYSESRDLPTSSGFWFILYLPHIIVQMTSDDGFTYT